MGIETGGPLLPPEETVSAARSLGLDISEHRARGLRLDSLKGADLVIGFEQRHIASAVVEGGARRSRTFLLTELVELVERLTDAGPEVQQSRKDSLHQILEAAHRARSTAPGANLEISDPMGRGPKEHGRVAARIAREVTQLARRLFPPPPLPPPPPPPPPRMR